MLVEDYLSQHPDVEALACFYYLWYEGEFKDPTNNKKEWDDYKSLLKTYKWEGGRHDGDCNNAASTCVRCVIQEMTTDAYDALSLFKEVEEPLYED